MRAAMHLEPTLVACVLAAGCGSSVAPGADSRRHDAGPPDAGTDLDAAQDDADVDDEGDAGPTATERLCPELDGARSLEAGPLMLSWIMHVDPGNGTLGVGDPGTWDSDEGFGQIAMILDEAARVMEAHGIPMVIASSGPYLRGHFPAFPDLVLRREAAGDLADLAARGHEIAVHEHNVTTTDEKVTLIGTLLGGDPAPLHIEGAVSHDRARELGFRSIAGNKDVPTQMIDQNLTPYRPDDADLYAIDPTSPVVRVRHGYDTTKGFAPEHTDLFTELVCAALGRLDPDRLDSQAFITHPDEYVWTRGGERRYKTRDEVQADFAAIDDWLSRDIDPLVEEGAVRWATMRTFVDEYEEWEAAAGPDANDGLFPPRAEIVAPGWSALPVGEGGLLNGWVREAAEQGGELWFVHASRGGLSRVLVGGPSPNVVEVVPSAVPDAFLFGSATLTAAAADGDAGLWLLAYEVPFGGKEGASTALTHFDTEGHRTVRSEAFDEYWTRPGFVYDLAVDAEGTVYVASSMGLARLEGDRFHGIDLGGRTAAFRILIEPDGDRWVGTYDTGLVHLGPGDETIETLTTADGLPSDSVLAIDLDSSGVLWLGTSRGAARRERGELVEIAASPQGLRHDHVTAVRADRLGYVWFGTYGGGVGRHDPGTGSWQWFSTADGALVGNYVLDITEDPSVDGRVYVSSYHGGGVSIFEPSGS